MFVPVSVAAVMSVAGRKKGVYTTVDVPCTFCGETLHLEPAVALASVNHFCIKNGRSWATVHPLDLSLRGV